ncbi:MAG: peptidylprolyl isomerase, partial [Pseudomonadota bacterium]
LLDGLARPPSSEHRAHAPLPLRAEDLLIARVGEDFFYLSDLERAARVGGDLGPDERLAPKSAKAERLLEKLIDQTLLANRAEAQGLDKTESVKERLEALRRELLANLYLENLLTERVSPDIVRAVYGELDATLQLGDEVRARHIVVGTFAEAEAVIADLENGADFGALARARSLDRATGPAGGEIGYFTVEMMPSTFAKAAFATSVGGVAPLFETEDGWHILQVEDRRSVRKPPFRELRPKIERFLRLQTIDKEMDDLRAIYDLEIFDADLMAAHAEAMRKRAEAAAEFPSLSDGAASTLEEGDDSPETP